MTAGESETAKLSYAPKIRQVYWCRYPEDAVKPEFSKNRPVVVPLTTKPQTTDRFSVKIISPFDSRIEAWVVCNHVTTVAVSRLRANKSVICRVSQDDFTKIVEKVFAGLPRGPQHT